MLLQKEKLLQRIGKWHARRWQPRKRQGKLTQVHTDKTKYTRKEKHNECT